MEQKNINFNDLKALKKRLDNIGKKYEQIPEDLLDGHYAEGVREEKVTLEIKFETMLRAYYMTSEASYEELTKKFKEEIARRQTIARQEALNNRCYKAIATLERQISNPDEYMKDTLWESIKKDKRKRAIDIDNTSSTYQNNATSIAYTKKEN